MTPRRYNLNETATRASVSLWSAFTRPSILVVSILLSSGPISAQSRKSAEPSLTLVQGFVEANLPDLGASGWNPVGILIAIVLQAILVFWLVILYRRRRHAELEREQFARLASAEHRHLNEVLSNVPGI